MKTVPLKRSLDVDLKEAISSFAMLAINSAYATLIFHFLFRRHYGREQVESLSSSLESIQKCRKDVVAALNSFVSNYIIYIHFFLFSDSSNPLDQTLRALRLWLSYILILEERLPFDNVNGVEIQFSWTCTFTPKVRNCYHDFFLIFVCLQIYTTFSSIHFEKLCVLFNIAAIYSCLAYASDRSSDEGVKEAVKQFKAVRDFSSHKSKHHVSGGFGVLTIESSIGTFCCRKIDSRVVRGRAFYAYCADVCTGSECIVVILFAMIRLQAQSGIYEKAVKDKLNRSLLVSFDYSFCCYIPCQSKLATQVANLYSSASSFSHSLTQLPPSLIAWFESVTSSLLSLFPFSTSRLFLLESNIWLFSRLDIINVLYSS